MQKDIKNAGSILASHRWKGKTKKQKSEYGKMMVAARESKRLKVKLEGKEENVVVVNPNK